MKVYTLLLTEGEINSLKDRLESDNYVNYNNDLKSVVEKIGYFFEPENTTMTFLRGTKHGTTRKTN